MQKEHCKNVGIYKITQKLLGEGSFSKVFLAYTPEYKQLAVKVIPRDQILKENIQSFESEVNLLKKCKHQNIVNFLDVKKSQKNFYIFLEYCEGGNLADYIKNKNKIPEVEALKIFGQIIRGMNVMKHTKIIHRDLKPANIMLKNGKVKIVDFGLAKKFSKGEMFNTFAGSPFSMAPEILKRYPYNDKVDVYSAGTVLYEMLFGVCPYKGKDIQKLLKEIEIGRLKEVDNTEVSKDVQNLLKEMLQPQPQKRMDLSQVLDFIQSYEALQREQRLKKYKAQTLQYLSSTVIGGILSSIQSPQAKGSYAEMDLRMYKKLCRRFDEQIAVN